MTGIVRGGGYLRLDALEHQVWVGQIGLEQPQLLGQSAHVGQLPFPAAITPDHDRAASERLKRICQARVPYGGAPAATGSRGTKD